MEGAGSNVKAFKEMLYVGANRAGSGKGRLGLNKGPKSYHWMATAAMTAL